MSNEQRCHSADSLAEWRSCEQVENGTPSTSPPYWDTDDDDGGAKPADLYGKFTWKIENFSQLNKRELKSDAFEVGGYKWYILIYPQGCDVSNHLSLFLCVFNHEKLLPGWSHFAQFTIAVVNKDPKKSKYSDTLHRFWKKEHDWGWKKFMELSKVSEGFINADTLVIKAEVQVVREKAHRPFRCLDRHYRRELVRVYLSNVEQICRRFVEERRDKLGKLIADKTRWASFRAFWLGIDQITKRRMSRDKADTILKVAVKHFFIEKEVTSTLVMDSLYSGLKALEYQSMSKSKNGGGKLVDMEELPVPLVHFEKDMFVLADDVLLLLERVALELLPQQPSPPKDDKGSQSRTKDGSSGEDLIKDSIERDERRLTELGRRTIEIFVLAHIFSRIEVAYQEDVALKRQEELIREEEAWQVENELKVKRGAAEKEKRTKKKQAKQKRNARKGKDRGRDDKLDVMEQDKHHLESAPDRRLLEELSSMQAQPALEKSETLVEASDMSDAGDDVPEARQPELDDRDTIYINWDTDLSEIRPTVEATGSVKQNGHVEKGSPSMIDDSCSTCSTDSVPSVVTNGPYKVDSLPYNRSRTSPAKVKDQRSRDTHDRTNFTQGGNSQSYSTTDTCEETGSSRDSRPEPETVICLKDRIKRHGQHLAEKEEQPATVPMKSSVKDQIEVERPHQSSTTEPSSSPFILVKKPHFGSQQPKQPSESTAITVTTAGIASSKDVLSLSPSKTEKSLPLQVPTASKCEAPKLTASSKSTVTYPLLALSRPLSAPLIPSQRPAAPVVSTVPITPSLSRSVSAVGRLGTDPSPSAPSFVPQSYRNAIVGKSSIGTVFTPLGSSSTFSHPPPILSSPSLLPPHSPSKNAPRYGLTFGTITAEAMHSQPVWREDRYPHQEASTSNGLHLSSLEHDISRTTINGISQAEASSSVPSTQAQGAAMSDEFPHLAIINDLLDEDQGIGKVYWHPFNRPYPFPRDTSTADLASPGGLSQLNRAEHYYGEGFYGSSNGSLHALRDAALFGQMEHPVYGNGAIPNRWPYHHADLPMLNLSTVDSNGYSYQLQEYLNSAENGYGVYRSANGL